MQEFNKAKNSESTSEESSKPRLSLKKLPLEEEEKSEASAANLSDDSAEKNVEPVRGLSLKSHSSSEAADVSPRKISLKPRLKESKEDEIEPVEGSVVKEDGQKSVDTPQDDLHPSGPKSKPKIALALKNDKEEDLQKKEGLIGEDSLTQEKKTPLDSSSVPLSEPQEEVLEDSELDKKLEPVKKITSVNPSKKLKDDKELKAPKKKSILPLLLCAVFLLFLIGGIIFLAGMLYRSFESHQKSQQILKETPRFVPPEPVAVEVIEEIVEEPLLVEKEETPVEVVTDPVIEEAKFVAPTANPAIIRKIQSLDISMTLNSTNRAKAKINGNMYYAGDLIDEGLNIRFVGIDVGKNLLIFKDSNGLTYARQF